jgi:hypothetical protein
MFRKQVKGTIFVMTEPAKLVIQLSVVTMVFTKKNIIIYDTHVPMHCQFPLMLLIVANTMVPANTIHI